MRSVLIPRSFEATVTPAQEKPRLGIMHYVNDSTTAAWLHECRTMESEGERSPAQTYNGERLVNVAGVAMVPESMVAELLSEVAA